VNAQGLALAALAAAAGNALNSAAGGGSFISFPALIFLGIPSIPANATNSTGMWVGGFGLIGGYRKELIQPSRKLIAAVATCVVAGTLGGILLLRTPQNTFNTLIPWLLLLSTLLFAFAPFVRKLAGQSGEDRRDLPYIWLLGLFPVALYGGFFGGGQGILTLALFGLAGMTNINRMNAVKSLLVFVNNGTPLIAFIAAGVVRWDVAAAMSVGALVGGYGGARIARRIAPQYVRAFVIAVGTIMTIVFFVRL